jgi:hypothetical protein
MKRVCFVRISEQTTNFALHDIKRLIFITEVERVYCAVRTESLYTTDTFCLYKIEVKTSPILYLNHLNRQISVSVLLFAWYK